MGQITVFGAGGRAGRAVTEEALRRGHTVTAAVRDPLKHAGLARPGLSVVGADITDPAAVAAAANGAAAVVHAVSPFSGPQDGFAGLDPEFFVRAADALTEGMAAAGVERLLVVGLFANLSADGAGLVMDDPALFPPEIRPFARSHTAGLERLREAAAPDWLMLTPPALLVPDGERTGRYRLRDESEPLVSVTQLSYADLAVAILDEAESPSRHRTRVAVIGG